MSKKEINSVDFDAKQQIILAKINEAVTSNFWGNIDIKFQNGEVTHLDVRQSINLKDLNGQKDQNKNKSEKMT